VERALSEFAAVRQLSTLANSQARGSAAEILNLIVQPDLPVTSTVLSSDQALDVDRSHVFEMSAGLRACQAMHRFGCRPRVARAVLGRWSGRSADHPVLPQGGCR